MTEYTQHEPSVFDLLAAAGCQPKSAGGGERGWQVCFCDPDGKPVQLSGTVARWQDSTYAQVRAVTDYLTSIGAKPSPEAVQRVRLAGAVGFAGQRSADALAALNDLTKSIAALRADKADPKCVQVWSFHDAPPELRALSRHGGDEDWLALIPAALAGSWFPWMEPGGPFGCCDVSEHPLDGGSVVRIGAHA